MQLHGEFSPFIKKMFFCLVVGGVTTPYTLSGPTTKKNTHFLCVSSLTLADKKNYKNYIERMWFLNISHQDNFISEMIILCYK